MLPLLAPAIAHPLCVALVALDAWSRSARLTMMVSATGSRIAFRDAVVLTTFGDAAAAVTPWRAGGEFARVLGARMSRVPLSTIVAALSTETLIVYSLAAATGTWLGARYGRQWLASFHAPGFGVSRSVIYALVALTVLVAAVVAGSPLRHRVGRWIRGARGAFDAARRIPPAALLKCAAYSAVSLGARVAVLPVLVYSMTADPPLGVVVLASFAIIHGQIAMPTPAGAGAVELAFLGGAAGSTHRMGALLGWWRLYMTILPTVAGFTLGGAAYGRAVLGAVPIVSRRFFPPRDNP